MRRILTRRPSPAMVVAIISLAFAIGTGGAVAFTSREQLDVDRVHSDEIVDGAVKKQDVRADAVGRFEVLENGDGPNAGLTEDHVLPNSLGAGAIGVLQRAGKTQDIGVGKGVVTTASCETGEEAVSGGGFWGGSVADEDLQIVESQRSSDGKSWQTRVRNGENADRGFTPLVVCLVK